METSQPMSSPVVASSDPGLLGTKIPSSVAFGVGILLFVMPFLEIKCNNMSLQTVSGLQLATGFKMKNRSSTNSFLNEVKTEMEDKIVTETTTKSDKRDPNPFAVAALGLGVSGFILSLAKNKAAVSGAMIIGIASAAALIGMMLDIKNKIKAEMPSTNSKSDSNALERGIENFAKELSNKINITVEFTPWYYVAVIAFLAASFFCFKRIQVKRN